MGYAIPDRPIDEQRHDDFTLLTREGLAIALRGDPENIRTLLGAGRSIFCLDEYGEQCWIAPEDCERVEDGWFVYMHAIEDEGYQPLEHRPATPEGLVQGHG
jgi:hypothetical protein